MTIKKIGIIAGVFAALLMSVPEGIAAPGKGGGGGHGGKGGGGGNHGGGHGGKGGSGGGGENACDGALHHKSRRCKRRVGGGHYKHQNKHQRVQYRRAHKVVTRTRTVVRTATYHCTLNQVAIYSRNKCKRIHRLARKGRGYAFADNSGYATYVSIQSARRLVVKRQVVVKRRAVKRKTVRRVVKRRTKVVYVQPRIVYVQAKRRVISRRRVVRRKVIIQGAMNSGNGYSYGGNGVIVHYGPVITKQAPY